MPPPIPSAVTLKTPSYNTYVAKEAKQTTGAFIFTKYFGPLLQKYLTEKRANALELQSTQLELGQKQARLARAQAYEAAAIGGGAIVHTDLPQINCGVPSEQQEFIANLKNLTDDGAYALPLGIFADAAENSSFLDAQEHTYKSNLVSTAILNQTLMNFNPAAQGQLTPAEKANYIALFADGNPVVADRLVQRRVNARLASITMQIGQPAGGLNPATGLTKIKAELEAEIVVLESPSPGDKFVAKDRIQLYLDVVRAARSGVGCNIAQAHTIALAAFLHHKKDAGTSLDIAVKTAHAAKVAAAGAGQLATTQAKLATVSANNIKLSSLIFAAVGAAAANPAQKVAIAAAALAGKKPEDIYTDAIAAGAMPGVAVVAATAAALADGDFAAIDPLFVTAAIADPQKTQLKTEAHVAVRASWQLRDQMSPQIAHVIGTMAAAGATEANINIALSHILAGSSGNDLVDGLRGTGMTPVIAASAAVALSVDQTDAVVDPIIARADNGTGATAAHTAAADIKANVAAAQAATQTQPVVLGGFAAAVGGVKPAEELILERALLARASQQQLENVEKNLANLNNEIQVLEAIVASNNVITKMQAWANDALDQVATETSASVQAEIDAYNAPAGPRGKALATQAQLKANQGDRILAQAKVLDADAKGGIIKGELKAAAAERQNGTPTHDVALAMANFLAAVSPAATNDLANVNEATLEAVSTAAQTHQVAIQKRIDKNTGLQAWTGITAGDIGHLPTFNADQKEFDRRARIRARHGAFDPNSPRFAYGSETPNFDPLQDRMNMVLSCKATTTDGLADNGANDATSNLASLYAEVDIFFGVDPKTGFARSHAENMQAMHDILHANNDRILKTVTGSDDMKKAGYKYLIVQNSRGNGYDIKMRQDGSNVLSDAPAENVRQFVKLSMEAIVNAMKPTHNVEQRGANAHLPVIAPDASKNEKIVNKNCDYFKKHTP